MLICFGHKFLSIFAETFIGKAFPYVFFLYGAKDTVYFVSRSAPAKRRIGRSGGDDDSGKIDGLAADLNTSVLTGRKILTQRNSNSIRVSYVPGR